MALEQEILSLFVANHWSLSTAESCTGGAIAAKITSVSGASKYFLGSIIAYSNDFKQRYLNVTPHLFQTDGAVSESVALSMVRGLIVSTHADFGVAVTGIAGPTGGSPQKPVGTVWIAVMRRDGEPVSQRVQLSGTRAEIVEAAAVASLQLLYKFALPKGK